jgi:thymidine kinase
MSFIPFQYHQSGYLEIILGCMYSGKTTRLLDIYRKCEITNISVITINHTLDNRYDENATLFNHDFRHIPCLKTNKLMDLTSIKEHVVLINEGQFFEDLKEFVELMLEQKKIVYVCGLDGDFKQRKFGQILDLIPLCDNVVKLTSLCSLCCNGTPAIFSKRITSEVEQTVVGSNNYIPTCRKCFNL